MFSLKENRFKDGKYDNVLSNTKQKIQKLPKKRKSRIQKYKN